MQTSPRGAIAHNVLLPRNFQIQIQKLRDTGFESRQGRIVVIGVVHLQCSKLFNGLECAVLSMVHTL